MKHFLILFFAMFYIQITNAQTTDLKIISNIGVQTDYTFEGAKGINLTFQYNFLPIIEQTHNDTILEDSKFYLKIKLFENNQSVMPAAGYHAIENVDQKLEYVIVFSGMDFDASKISKKVTQFIPYSALNMPQGFHVMHVQAQLSGKDAVGTLYKQTIQKEKIEFDKPATQIFTMNIDHVEVNPFNSSGQAWDYAIFKTDAPDVGVNIMVGNTTVYKKNVNDSYMFAAGPDARNISFTISKNDKVVVKIEDIDIMFHDFIAKWIFSTNKMPGVLYTFKKPSSTNIKSCLLTFTYE